MTSFLTGVTDEPCTVIDEGHARERDLTLELPGSPLEAIMAAEVWVEEYDRLAELIRAHRTTLVFVNTRRHAERAARHLGRAARRGRRHVAPRQPREGASAQGRGALEGRAAEGARRDGLARARHRHRRRRSRLPARLAARDLGVPAARRPLGPRARAHSERAPVPAVARRPRRVHGAAREHSQRSELDAI